MLGEKWKYIDGFVGVYAVSNLGRVFRLTKVCRAGYGKTCTKPGRFMETSETDRGYVCVSLSHAGHKKTVRLSRMVASCFVENPCGLPEVNHKDGDKRNNKSDNLEWSTHHYNMVHAGDNGLCRYGQKHARAIITNGQAREIRELLGHMSVSEVAKKMGATYSCVNSIRKGLTWKLVV